MKVLVTGASGFIGRRVVAKLQQEARFEIVATSQNTNISSQGIEIERANLLSPGGPEALIKRVRPSHLIHLAWNAQPGLFWSAPDNLDWAAATIVLARAFLETGGERAVFAGTCAEYDWTGDSYLHEGSPLKPATLYGAIKDATRRAVCTAGENAGVPIAWGRVFWLYGPNEAPGRLVSDVASALIDGRIIETSMGEQRRDFLHVDDVAGAFVAALNSDWSGPFNIGSGHAISVRILIEALANAAGRPELIHFGARPRPKADPDLLEADIHVLRDLIGFAPSISLERGISETFNWWQARMSLGRDR